MTTVVPLDGAAAFALAMVRLLALFLVAPFFSHVLLPFQDERMELSVATRVGEPGNLTLFGVGLSRESSEYRDLQIARDSDFGNPETAPAGTELTGTDAPGGLDRETLEKRTRELLGVG